MIVGIRSRQRPAKPDVPVHMFARGDAGMRNKS
jgi:hypothetical protein